MSFAKVTGVVIALIVAVALWFFLAHDSSRRFRGMRDAVTPNGSAKGKPSPMIQGRASAPAVVAAPSANAPPAMIQTPPTLSLPAAGVSFPADRKGFNNGCKGGTLTLAPAAVSFTCPSDPGKGFSAALAQIRDADDDGIQLVSGEKYHFKIEGHDKGTMRTLFQTWYLRANARQPDRK